MTLSKHVETPLYVLSVMIYGPEMGTITIGLVHKLKVSQRAMERAMLGVGFSTENSSSRYRTENQYAEV